MANNNGSGKSLESWIWDAACSIRGAKDAPKYKDYILPLIFTKRLCDVFDDELNRIAKEVGSRRKAFRLAKADHKLVRFYRWEYWKSFATFGPVPILSKGRFTSIAVAIPSSAEEQQAIAKPLVALETKVEVAEKKVAALQDLFRTLLHELMTAKTRVHELEIGTDAVA